MAKFQTMSWCCTKPCRAQVLAEKRITRLQIPSKFGQILHRLESLHAEFLEFWLWPFHSTEGTISPFTFMAFARKAFYAQGCRGTWVLLPRDAFRKDMFFTHKLGAFTNACLYVQVLLHREAFTRGSFYTHARAGISTHRCLYTAMLLHRNAFTH